MWRSKKLKYYMKLYNLINCTKGELYFQAIKHNHISVLLLLLSVVLLKTVLLKAGIFVFRNLYKIR